MARKAKKLILFILMLFVAILLIIYDEYLESRVAKKSLQNIRITQRNMSHDSFAYLLKSERKKNRLITKRKETVSEESRPFSQRLLREKVPERIMAKKTRKVMRISKQENRRHFNVKTPVYMVKLKTKMKGFYTSNREKALTSTPRLRGTKTRPKSNRKVVDDI